MLLDDVSRIVNLAFPGRDLATIEQFDQHGDVPGLDQIKQVLARPV